MIDPIEIAKWREAHQGIQISENALVTVAPFPSLYATDFAVYLQSKGFPAEMVQFVVDAQREVAWVYDNWAKAQRDGNPGKLLDDMLNNATSKGDGANYDAIRRFVADYAKANGIALSSDQANKPDWMNALGPPGVQEGTGTGTIGEEPIFPQRPVGQPGSTITAPPLPMPTQAETYKIMPAADAPAAAPELTGADHVDR